MGLASRALLFWCRRRDRVYCGARGRGLNPCGHTLPGTPSRVPVLDDEEQIAWACMDAGRSSFRHELGVVCGSWVAGARCAADRY